MLPPATTPELIEKRKSMLKREIVGVRMRYMVDCLYVAKGYSPTYISKKDVDQRLLVSENIGDIIYQKFIDDYINGTGIAKYPGSKREDLLLEYMVSEEAKQKAARNNLS